LPLNENGLNIDKLNEFGGFGLYTVPLFEVAQVACISPLPCFSTAFFLALLNKGCGVGSSASWPRHHAGFWLPKDKDL